MIAKVRGSAEQTIDDIKKSGAYRLEAIYSSGLVETKIRDIVLNALSSDNITNMRYGSKYVSVLEKMIVDLSSASYDTIDVPQSKMETLAEVQRFLKEMMTK